MNEQQEQMVKRLRAAYTRYRRLSAHNFRDRNDKAWLKLSDLLLSQSVPAETYMRWCFDFYRNYYRRIPYVNQVASEKTFNLFLAQRGDDYERRKAEIRLQLDTLQTQLRLGKSPQDIITDKFLEIGPVLRYALAVKAGHPEWAEHLKDAADVEMMDDELQRQLFHGYISQ